MKFVKIKEEFVSDIIFFVSEELEVDFVFGDQLLFMGVFGVQSECFLFNLEVEVLLQVLSVEVNVFFFWNLVYVKMEF